MRTVERLRVKVLQGKEITREDALFLLQMNQDDDIQELIRSAGEITKRFHGAAAWLCSIVNAKSGLCAEDCSFCVQSVKFDTDIRRHPLLDSSVICEKARLAKERGTHEFCIVTSGASLTDHEFDQLLHIVACVRSQVAIRLDVSVGFLSSERALELKKAGVTRVNHNVQTSARFYPEIVTSHSYQDRLGTLSALRQADLELCCGVILGLGETPEDRIDAAFELRKFRPECVPINLLDPRPGTPLAGTQPLDPMEIIKTIAIFRFVLPHANLRLAGGRRAQLGQFQNLALCAGINGLIVGELLTTKGNPVPEDFEMLREAGFKW